MSAKAEEHHNGYKALKERLWNQPRARQVLERLEQHRASPDVLETVAEKFASGAHGEAEIQSAICFELLRNRDRKAILKRVADMRSVFSRIRQDLSHAASDLHQLKCWESHIVMGYDDWTEFSEDVLGLSDGVADSLLTAREQASNGDLDDFLQAMIKGYVVPPGSKGPRVESPEGGRRKRNPEAIIKDLKDRLDRAEFQAGKEIRDRKQLEKDLEKTRAEMYEKVREKQDFIDKLTRNP